MDNERKVNLNFEALAWGALLIWWGLRWWLLVSLPNGIGLLGTGVILLGLNAMRSLNGIPTKGFTTILGILALVFGGLIMASKVLQLSFELPLFEIVLIGLGVFLLASELVRVRKTS